MNKTTRLDVRLTPHDLVLLREAAAPKSVSEWLRTVAIGVARAKLSGREVTFKFDQRGR